MIANRLQRPAPPDPAETGAGSEGWPEYVAPGIECSSARITSGFSGTCVGGNAWTRACVGNAEDCVNACETAVSAAEGNWVLLPGGIRDPAADLDAVVAAG